jgi:hypothetical protein
VCVVPLCVTYLTVFLSDYMKRIAPLESRTYGPVQWLESDLPSAWAINHAALYITSPKAPIITFPYYVVRALQSAVRDVSQLPAVDALSEAYSIEWIPPMPSISGAWMGLIDQKSKELRDDKRSWKDHLWPLIFNPFVSSAHSLPVSCRMM